MSDIYPPIVIPLLAHARQLKGFFANIADGIQHVMIRVKAPNA
jgi:hypothetical protein